MKAAETKLQSIMEGTKQYVVPLFQRPYSWTRKEWQTLWDDLIELCAEENPRQHFVGSIVTMPTQSVPEGVAKYLLIDGQQRLTTIFVLLALIRNHAQELPNQLADQIENLFLTNPYSDDADFFKLLPTQIDRETFAHVIKNRNGLPPNADSNRIAEAAGFFERKLGLKDAPPLDVLKKVVTGNLVLVSITLDHDDNPYLIFESLNAKGKPLSPADLIRNYFFMRIHVGEQEAIYSRYWKPMQDRLGEDLTEFIRHFLMREGTVVKQSDVYFALRERAAKLAADKVVAYLAEIARFSDFYVKLLKPDEEPNVSIRERMKRLNRIEVTTAYPFLLNVYQDYADEKITQEEFVEILDVLENYLVRRFVCGVTTMGLNRMFPALYKQADGLSTFVSGVKESLRTKNYPRDSEFREKFASARFYGAGTRIDLTKLILERLESSFGHKEAVSFQNLTIEHVMPQTLSEWWREHLGAEAEETYAVWLDTIGNLTLTAYNSELSNSPFPRKKQLLSESHVELNDYFENAAEWRENQIQARGAELAERALQIWQSFGNQEGAAKFNSNVTGKRPVALTIFGEEFAAVSWREVLQKTLETIAALDEDKFELICDKFPTFVSRDANALRQPKRLQNNFFVETNFSAKSVYNGCLQITQFIGLSPDDWRVELTDENQ